jgi:hypothetical protein
MTHSLNGNIVVSKPFSGYGAKAGHKVVSEFMRNFGSYAARQDTLFEAMTYSRLVETERFGKQKVQPKITLFDIPEPFYKFRDIEKSPFGKDKWLVSIVESGSHVGFGDVEHAREIYDLSLNLGRELRKIYSGRNLQILFDDEKQIYLPVEFRKLIKRVA